MTFLYPLMIIVHHCNGFFLPDHSLLLSISFLRSSMRQSASVSFVIGNMDDLYFFLGCKDVL